MARILVVDDDVPGARPLRRVLMRSSFEVEFAHSGNEGLQKLIVFEPDIVLSDFRMPGMTGLEMLQQVRRLRPLALRIMLSGFADLNSVTRAVNEGEISRFISKPWDDRALIDTLVALLEDRDQLHERSSPLAQVVPP